MNRNGTTSLAMLLGFAALALILGALGFQYLAHLPPCEMCHWQRWPHIAAAVFGIVGAMLIRLGFIDRSASGVLVGITTLLIATSGAIGVYHAGVEWHWWPGPSTCTGPAFHFTGKLDLNAPVVPCDAAAWRLFGISLAGYNAIISLGLAATAFVLLAGSRRRR
jgi:disulfide bond formation protein DsbB